MKQSELITELERLISISDEQANRIIDFDCINREFELKRKNMAVGKVIAYKHILSILKD